MSRRGQLEKEPLLFCARAAIVPHGAGPAWARPARACRSPAAPEEGAPNGHSGLAWAWRAFWGDSASKATRNSTPSHPPP